MAHHERHQGSPDAQKGEFGADQGNRRLLRTALEEIGRNEQSIRPPALARYDVLLHCQQVRGRVSPQATTAERQEVASAALKDAIAAVSLPRDRLIAQAILGATEDFAHKTVERRKEVLAQQHQITPDMFKHRRKAVIAQLVGALMDSEGDGISSFEYNHALDDVTRVAVDAYRLHIAWLVYLFVCALNRALHDAGNWPDSLCHHNGQYVIIQNMLEAHAALIVSAGYCFDQRYTHRTRLRRVLPTDVLDQIENNLTDIFDALPIGAYQREIMCNVYFAQQSKPLFFRNSSSAFHYWAKVSRGWADWVSKLTFDNEKGHPLTNVLPANSMALLHSAAVLHLDLTRQNRIIAEDALNTVTTYYRASPDTDLTGAYGSLTLGDQWRYFLRYHHLSPNRSDFSLDELD